MTNGINDLKAKVLTGKPSNKSVCLVGDEKLNRHTSVPKVILIIFNYFILHIFIMLSYLPTNLQSNPNKGPHQDVRLNAAKILAPRSSHSSDID